MVDVLTKRNVFVPVARAGKVQSVQVTFVETVTRIKGDSPLLLQLTQEVPSRLL